MKLLTILFQAACALIMTVLLALILAFATSGCSSPTGTAYKVEHATVTSVEVAMGVWNDYVGQNHPPIQKEIQVKQAYEKYQAAMLLAVDASRTFAATQSVPDQQKAQVALAQSQQLLADLIQLIRSFGGKL